MNRIQFMNELEYLLQDIPEEEKQEALQYYNDYFDEAGDRREEDLIQELESPAKVAAIIKDGLGEDIAQSGEYSETGYEDDRFSTKQEIDRRTYLKESDYNYQNFREQRRNEQKQRGSGARGAYQEPGQNQSSLLRVILIFAALVLAIPVGATLIGIGAGAIGIIAGLGGAIVGLLIGGLALVGVGLGYLISIPSAGLAVCGVGFLLTAVGLALAVLTVWLAATVLPAIGRGIMNLCRMPFRNRGGDMR